MLVYFNNRLNDLWFYNFYWFYIGHISRYSYWRWLFSRLGNFLYLRWLLIGRAVSIFLFIFGHCVAKRSQNIDIISQMKIRFWIA